MQAPVLEIRNDIDDYLAAEASRFFRAHRDYSMVEVVINSAGGSVISAYTIFSAMMDFPGLVVTRNVGIAASAAGWLLIAGKRVLMNDYALVMIHDPMIGDQEGYSDKEMRALSAFKNSIVKIFTRRTRMSEEEVTAAMAEETWYDSSEALEKGVVEEVIETPLRELVENKLSGSRDPSRIAQIVNKYIPSQTDEPMDKEVLNALDLSEGTKPSVAAEKIKNLQLEHKAATTERDNLKQQLEEARNSLKEFEDAEAHRAEQEAQKLVQNAVKEGKISNDDVAEWVKFANNDFAGTEKILNGMAGTNKTKQPLEKFVNSGGQGSNPNPTPPTPKVHTFQDVLNEAKKA